MVSSDARANKATDRSIECLSVVSNLDDVGRWITWYVPGINDSAAGDERTPTNQISEHHIELECM